MPHRKYSRREFVKQSSLMGFGAALAFGGASSGLSNLLLAANVEQVKEIEPIIDIHQHLHYSGRSDELLIAHQKAMGITTTILLPSGRPLSSASTHYGFSNGLEADAYGNELCYRFAQLHPDQFTFGACEVPDVAGATTEIEKYLKLGAKVIGELKFGVACDSREMQKIYKVAEAYNVPVIMHWQFKKYNYHFDKFHKMLKKYPKVNFLGHAQTWWANVDLEHKDQKILYPKTKVTAGGITDRLLSDYPNMFADLSAGSGLNFFTRDEEHTKGFLERHQDKLIYGSDCSDRIGHGPACQGLQTIDAIRRFSPSQLIERKLLYENAKRIFQL